ncbi:MAG: hypothetical protein COU33_01815 [Candidatus Magasanikbacteria bacterium CG10_big_fil_rev_8_21_14_0_10_43_6]|uniref:Uncharacterized protein n=1 Tax=Candidatus Magasanikbacteria bacterium CG10_big_fil_rev_8_21_14_0_10_43_6 TaxID=1974650 RepID=A0A2M6W1S5_9BACT|nr:MAG: hypothetical protein COU33_01815 [Candidatus Magasanikbacteria bacterium CG10_big_fil_rev_8_21_14_0_10_43_6]
MNRLELQYGRVGREHPEREARLVDAFHRDIFDTDVFGAPVIKALREKCSLETDTVLGSQLGEKNAVYIESVFRNASLNSEHLANMFDMLMECEDQEAHDRMKDIATTVREKHIEWVNIRHMSDAEVLSEYFDELSVEERSYFLLFFADFYEDEAEYIEDELGPELDIFFMDRIALLVEQGIIPLSLEEIKKRIKEVRIRPLDPTVQSTTMGEHFSEQAVIFIDTSLEEDKIQNTYTHEMLHNISAVAYADIGEDDDPPTYVKRQGGLKEYYHQGLHHMWLDEAVTEGLTTKLTKDIPSERALLLEDTDVYQSFCLLLEALLQGVSKQSGVSLEDLEKKLIHAYIIPAHDTGKTIEEYMEDLAGVPDILRMLDRFIQEAYLPYQDTKHHDAVEEQLDDLLDMLTDANWKGVKDVLEGSEIKSKAQAA